MLLVKKSNRFLKDYERAKKRGWNLTLLDEAIHILAKGEKLPPKYHDHKLVGTNGYRDCHIKPDWILVYKINKQTNVLELLLIATGTHSDLFE